MTVVDTRLELTIDVLGLPAPQGSKRHVGNGRLVESSKRVAPWRAEVAKAARARARLTGWTTLDCAVQAWAWFWLPAPKTMPRGRTYPTTYPDLSKLLRSTEDALVTAGVLRDDALIVRWVTEKNYAEPGGLVGARVKIAPKDGVLL